MTNVSERLNIIVFKYNIIDTYI